MGRIFEFSNFRSLLLGQVWVFDQLQLFSLNFQTQLEKSVTLVWFLYILFYYFNISLDIFFLFALWGPCTLMLYNSRCPCTWMLYNCKLSCLVYKHIICMYCCALYCCECTAVHVLLCMYCCACTAVLVLLWMYCCACTAVHCTPS